MAPPQVTATSEASLRSLSAPELALHWVVLSRRKESTKAVLDEFTRRYWIEQEEIADACGVLRIHPAWRIIPTRPDPKGDGPQVFAEENG